MQIESARHPSAMHAFDMVLLCASFSLTRFFFPSLSSFCSYVMYCWIPAEDTRSLAIVVQIAVVVLAVIVLHIRSILT